MQRATNEVGIEKLWARPFGLAPIGFHIRHIAESIDRLLTYLEDSTLSPEQLAVLPQELQEEIPAASLFALLETRLAAAETRIRQSHLEGHSYIGRARIEVPKPTLLAHIAEHTQRHLGQIATLRRLLPQL